MWAKLKDNYGYLLVFILGLTLGACVTYTWFPKVETVVTQVPVVKTEVEYRDRTEIQYVTKESTGDADVEITKAQPQVSVKFNGQDYTFGLLQDEQQKFDKGKLVVDQSSTLNIDVSAQVQQQVEDGIRKAFEDRKKEPRYRIGIAAETGTDLKPGGQIRVVRQGESQDIDFKINTDKKVTAGITWWLK